MLSRKERILLDRINLKDFQEFIDKYCTYGKRYENCQFLTTYTFFVHNSLLEFRVKCPREDYGSIREITLMRKNEKWYEEVDEALIMEHNHFVNSNEEWDWSWQIVDRRISYVKNINKENIFENIISFIIDNSKEEEGVRIKREHKLQKLNI